MSLLRRNSLRDSRDSKEMVPRTGSTPHRLKIHKQIVRLVELWLKEHGFAIGGAPLLPLTDGATALYLAVSNAVLKKHKKTKKKEVPDWIAQPDVVAILPRRGRDLFGGVGIAVEVFCKGDLKKDLQKLVRLNYVDIRLIVTDGEIPNMKTEGKHPIRAVPFDELDDKLMRSLLRSRIR